MPFGTPVTKPNRITTLLCEQYSDPSAAMALTRTGLILAALILLLGAAGQWLGSPFDQAWRYLAAIWLLGLVAEVLWARGFTVPVEWHLPARVRLGVRSSAAIELLPVARACELQVQLAPPAGTAAVARVERLRLGRQTSRRLELAFDPRSLGPIEWPGFEARLRGRLGLAWWPRRIGSSIAMRVEPDALGSDVRAAPGRAGGIAGQHRPGAGTDPWGLREYQPGDPLRSLDWKATARMQRLLVRETVEDQHLDLVLVLDAGRAGCLRAGPLSRLHHHVNVACRFAQRAADAGDRIGLVVMQGDVLLRLSGLRGTAGVRKLRASLSDVQPRPVESSSIAGALAVRRIASSRALVIWLADLDQASLPALEEAARLLLPKHQPLFAQLIDAEVQAEATREARGALDVHTALAAKQWTEGQARAARRLRQRGCEVVAARPERLEAALLDRYRRLRARRRI